MTEHVAEELAAWQSRPLDAIYPVLLIEAIVVKIRDGQVANRPVYVALGIGVDGRRDVLGHVGVLEAIGELWPKATVQLAWCIWSAPVCGMRPRSTGGRSAGAAGGLHPDRVAELAVPAGMPTPRAPPDELPALRCST